MRRTFQSGEAQGYDELLKEPWILDMDGTVKPLYGQQEQAVRGYNPTKMGRPSHVYQTYIIASIRMVLEVEVQAGNRRASQYAQPGLWAWQEKWPSEQWPKLNRGDVSWGTEHCPQWHSRTAGVRISGPNSLDWPIPRLI